MQKEYYSVEEFGERLGFSYRSILAAIRKGRIRAFKIGSGRRNPYRIPHSEIIRVEICGMREINPKLKDPNEMQ